MKIKLRIQEKQLSYHWVLFPLGAFAFLSYGLLLNKLGFYWDDWPYIWTRLELGFHGLLRHFSFSRPVAGQIHNIAILITQGKPLLTQIYGLLMQIFGAYCFGLLICNVWQEKRFAAALGSLLFIAYPGFTMRPIAINFSFSYFLMGMLCLSFTLSIQAIKSSHLRLLKLVAAAIIACINLFASEYFFLLELLRPFLLFAASNSIKSPKERARKVFHNILLFGIVFLSGTAYRMFFNKTQTLHYDFKLLTELQLAPWKTITEYLAQLLRDSFRVIFSGWATITEIPNAEDFGIRSTLIYVIICLVVSTICTVTLFSNHKNESSAGNMDMLLIGILAILLAGQPFWLTKSPINFVFQNCRYTLPFIPGISLVLTALLDRPGKFQVPFLIFSAVCIGLSSGHLFVTGNEYRRDWTITKDFFTQLKQRIPELEENTVVVTNVLPIRFSTDNSLTAPLNWIYADDYETDRIPYMLYTNTKRENTLSGLEEGHKIFQEYLSGQFYGNTNDIVSIYYSAPGCVHVLDPEIDVWNQMIPEIDRESARLTNYSRISIEAESSPLPEKLFGKTNSKGWCYYYESADLARQQQKWEDVAALGDTAFTLNDHPNDPIERIPFIEGYAHVQRWQDALAQTRAAMETTPIMNDPLCALWQRIERDLKDVPIQNELNSLLDCTAINSQQEVK